jgi:hypothetical protein
MSSVGHPRSVSRQELNYPVFFVFLASIWGVSSTLGNSAITRRSPARRPRPMTGLAHSRANRNARIPATAPARRSRVTSELVQWTFENGLFAGCHSKKIVRGRCEGIVSGDRVKRLAKGSRTNARPRPRLRRLVHGQVVPFRPAHIRGRFVAGRQEHIASWSVSDRTAPGWWHYLFYQAQRHASAAS